MQTNEQKNARNMRIAVWVFLFILAVGVIRGM